MGLYNNTVMSIRLAHQSALQFKEKFEDGPKRKMETLCAEILMLNDKKIEILKYLESRITIVAPNLCEIIGPKVTSKLISAAGGIRELSRIPASNI